MVSKFYEATPIANTADPQRKHHWQEHPVFNKIVVNKFNDLLHNLLDEYNFAPCGIYNVDESGISTISNHIPQVISYKGKRLSRTWSNKYMRILLQCCRKFYSTACNIPEEKDKFGVERWLPS